VDDQVKAWLREKMTSCRAAQMCAYVVLKKIKFGTDLSTYFVRT
jgi:hypothetical protein